MKARSISAAGVLMLLLGNVMASPNEQEVCERSCAEVLVYDTARSITIKDAVGGVIYNEFIQNLSEPVPAGRAARKAHIIPLEQLESIGYSLKNGGSTTTTVVTHQLPGGGSVTTVSVFSNGVLISQTLITVNSKGVVQVHNMIV